MGAVAVTIVVVAATTGGVIVVVIVIVAAIMIVVNVIQDLEVVPAAIGEGIGSVISVTRTISPGGMIASNAVHQSQSEAIAHRKILRFLAATLVANFYQLL